MADLDTLADRLRCHAAQLRPSLENAYTRTATTVATIAENAWNLLNWLYAGAEQFGQRRTEEIQEMPGFLEYWADSAEDTRRIYDNLAGNTDHSTDDADSDSDD